MTMKDKKIILISGCSSGIGKLMAENLANKGDIVYAGVRNLAKSAEVIQQWQQFPNLNPIELDVTIDDSCIKAVDTIIKNHSRIDVLINNAGFSLVGPIDDYSSEDYLGILNTNTVGPFRLIKAILPVMKKHNQGKIINIISLNGFLALPNFSLYCSSKFALEGLGKSLAFELKRYNIKVVNIEPGAIKMNQQLEQDTKKLPHKSAREKFVLIKMLLPLISGEKVANAVMEVVESNNPPRNIQLGRDARLIYLLNKYLPDGILNYLIQKVWDR